MEGFSGVLKLRDLDDFITPSQQCILPTVSKGGPVQQRQNKKNDPPKNASSISIRIENDGTYSEIKQASDKRITSITTLYTAPRITLADCLACSGCITSAESMLIEEQSYQKFLYILNDINNNIKSSNKYLTVVTVCSQSLASLAVKYGLSSKAECMARLTKVLREKFRIDFVFSSSEGRLFALHEMAKDFVSRYQDKNSRNNNNRNVSTFSVCSSQSMPYNDSIHQSIESGDKAVTGCNNCLPLLTSVCPGWICYAEKTHGNWILPHISTIKSPQQICGQIIKSSVMAQRLFKRKASGGECGNSGYKQNNGCHNDNDNNGAILTTKKRSKQKVGGNNIFHTTIMPCFDKKLEASRQDFVNSSDVTREDLHEGTFQREVDCVLSTMELDRMFSEMNVSLSNKVDNDSCYDESSSWNSMLYYGDQSRDLFDWFQCCENDNGESGGYANYMIRYCAKEIFGITIPRDTPIVFESRRNVDLKVVSLPDLLKKLPQYSEEKKRRLHLNTLSHDNSSTTHHLPLNFPSDITMNFAIANGFRNIQNVVQRMKYNSRKGGSSPYDFVEIMACPSGCINGGGQLRPAEESHDTQKTHLIAVREMYNDNSFGSVENSPSIIGKSMKSTTRNIDDDFYEQIEQFERRLFGNGDDDELDMNGMKDASDVKENTLNTKEFFRTQYHPIEKNINSIVSNW